MQLVLLSGGSGKRLWPLSNNARSKQFLPLLEKEDGSMESMVQRVVRQAKEANLTNDITLATNASQQDIIVNQLGDSVNLVTEPERRDTFPAIALAASYLKLAKQCADDEVVVIMPCDPYTEFSYFETIGKMVDCVKQNVADLILMGIQPTYPSEKYGYVVPFSSSSATDYKMVSRFTEKPTVEKAKELLDQNAYWNGGVFAFRLGYIMNIVHKYMKCESFEDTRAHYYEFPKISFDYEVAEKAESVAVVPFNGEWKDLGTWNTLTEEIKQHVIGNAVIGTHCENTHIINELPHPIFVDGLKDVVVAACPDGILVCGKEQSEDIKKSVENLTSHPIFEEKSWGTCRVLDDSIYADGRHSITNIITLKEGKSFSYQRHHHRRKTWTIVQGEGIFVIEGKEQGVKVGDVVVTPVEHWHAIKALSELTFIEVLVCTPFAEEDIEKSNWIWTD